MLKSSSTVQKVVFGFAGRPGARHPARGVDDDAGRLDETGPHQRRERERGRGHVAARRGDHARGEDLRPEQLGEPVGEVAQPLGAGVGLAVPGRVQVGVLQPEVGGQVHDPAHPTVELGDQLLALAVGQGQEHEVEPVDRHRVPGLEGLVAVVGREVRVELGDGRTGLRGARGHGHVELRVGRGEPQQLRAGVPRRPDHTDLGHPDTLYGIHAWLCNTLPDPMALPERQRANFVT